MTLFVAFLRGINVGGHIVKKEQLRGAFESLGFQNVVTHKQSGNVIFETGSSREVVKPRIEEKLRGSLGFGVTVFLRTIPELKSIISQDHFNGQEKEDTSFMVTMLPCHVPKSRLQFPLTIPKSRAEILSARGSEVFSVTHGGGEGALPNPFLESKLNVKATTRNFNIIREIVQKYS